MSTTTKKQFTFKTVKPMGKWRSFESNRHIIKLDKKEVGSILDEEPFTIRLMVVKKDLMEDGNKNCPWKWISLKKQSTTLEESKVYLNEVINLILDKYTLHSM